MARARRRLRLLAAFAAAMVALGGGLLSWAEPAHGPCRSVSFEEVPYTICEVEAGADLRLVLTAPDGNPVASWERLEAGLAPEERIGFAMNAGMYHPDRRPVGLYIEQGRAQAPIVTSEGPGNFGLLPNGVFCWGGQFRVIESRAFAAAPPECRFATQSGPMLVIDGALHPKFLPGSESRHIRNGVGVSRDGRRAVFAISDAPVTFHQFARLFRDRLGLPQALYLDGSVSRLLAPGLERRDFGQPLGPIVALVSQR